MEPEEVENFQDPETDLIISVFEMKEDHQEILTEIKMNIRIIKNSIIYIKIMSEIIITIILKNLSLMTISIIFNEIILKDSNINHMSYTDGPGLPQIVGIMYLQNNTRNIAVIINCIGDIHTKKNSRS